MKHEWNKTIPILAWLLFATILGFWVAPQETSARESLGFEPLTYIIVIMAMILAGAILWSQLIKHAKPEHIDIAFAVGIGLVMSRVAMLLAPQIFFEGTTATMMAARLVTMGGFAYVYWKITKAMQKSWKNAIKYTQASNLLVVTAITVSAALIGADMPAWVAITILALASIYDAVAVWKTKSMIGLAKFFIGRRMLPGIAVPYKRPVGKFAILGGGDVFFLVLVSASFHATNTTLMYASAAGMFASIVFLFMISKKDTFYPALPFMLAGALIGIGVGWLL